MSPMPQGQFISLILSEISPRWLGHRRSGQRLYRALTALPCDQRTDYCWAATNSS